MRCCVLVAAGSFSYASTQLRTAGPSHNSSHSALLLTQPPHYMQNKLCITLTATGGSCNDGRPSGVGHASSLQPSTPCQASSPPQEVGGALHERVAQVGADAEGGQEQVGTADELLRGRKRGERQDGRLCECLARVTLQPASRRRAKQRQPGMTLPPQHAQHIRPIKRHRRQLYRHRPCSSRAAAAGARPGWRQRAAWRCGP